VVVALRLAAHLKLSQADTDVDACGGAFQKLLGDDLSSHDNTEKYPRC
jgi:hypothetical protein